MSAALIEALHAIRYKASFQHASKANSRRKIIAICDRAIAAERADAMKRGIDEKVSSSDVVEAAEPTACGWLYTSDDGVEWSDQHPIESGEDPYAKDIREATAHNLLFELSRAWEELNAIRSRPGPIPSPSSGEHASADDLAVIDEIYQAFSALAHYCGLSDDPEIVRALDFIAYPDARNEPLTPWPATVLRPSGERERWVLVPVNPTQKMIAEGWAVLRRAKLPRLGPGPGLIEVWNVMLAASLHLQPVPSPKPEVD